MKCLVVSFLSKSPTKKIFNRYVSKGPVFSRHSSFQQLQQQQPPSVKKPSLLPSSLPSKTPSHQELEFFRAKARENDEQLVFFSLYFYFLTFCEAFVMIASLSVIIVS